MEAIMGFMPKHDMGRVIHALQSINHNLFKLCIAANMITGRPTPAPEDETVAFQNFAGVAGESSDKGEE
jgi:hypothetical protein